MAMIWLMWILSGGVAVKKFEDHRCRRFYNGSYKIGTGIAGYWKCGHCDKIVKVEG